MQPDRPVQPKGAPPANDQEQPKKPSTVIRISSEDLFREGREIEILHGGRVYRLRMTQLNKLILTA